MPARFPVDWKPVTLLLMISPNFQKTQKELQREEINSQGSLSNEKKIGPQIPRPGTYIVLEGKRERED